VAEHGHITEETPHRNWGKAFVKPGPQIVANFYDEKSDCADCFHGLEANDNCSGSEVVISVSVFWDVTKCCTVKVDRYFVEMYSLHLQVRKSYQTSKS
jgi:hypothetical protein